MAQHKHCAILQYRRNMSRNDKNKIIKQKDGSVVFTVEKLGNDLEGVCYCFGSRNLVKGALPGETVRCIDPQVSGNITIYQLAEVITPSEYRIPSPCPYQDQCGACTLSFVTPEYQRKIKTDLIRRRLNDYRQKVEDIEFVDHPIRNKLHLAFKQFDDRLGIGFFSSESHKVIDIPECLMHDKEGFGVLRNALETWISRFGVLTYNPRRQRGNLRFAVVRMLGKSLSITLTFYKKIENGLDYLYALLKQYFESVSLNVNINPNLSNAVFRDTPNYYLGDTKIHSQIVGVNFLYGAGDFLQTNTEICAKIYSYVAEYIKELSPSVIVDAYSGIGITSVLFARNVPKVISIEISDNAVKTARETAELNGVNNIEFIADDFSNALKNISVDCNSAIFVDPPRAGLTKKVCNAIISKGFDNIVYLSCSPGSLVEDIRVLSKNYDVVKIKPYDMFPMTDHVETLVCLKRIR